MPLKIEDVSKEIEKLLDGTQKRTEDLIRCLENLVRLDRQLISLLNWLKAKTEEDEKEKSDESM